MKLNRRDLLKKFGIGVAAVALPLPEVVQAEERGGPVPGTTRDAGASARYEEYEEYEPDFSVVRPFIGPVRADQSITLSTSMPYAMRGESLFNLRQDWIIDPDPETIDDGDWDDNYLDRDMP